jgi:hypothetical protein
MWERGWGTLSAEDWRKGIFPRTANKQASPAGAGYASSNQEWESLYKQQWEENSTGEGGRPTSHGSCKQTCRPEKVGAVSPFPA